MFDEHRAVVTGTAGVVARWEDLLVVAASTDEWTAGVQPSLDALATGSDPAVYLAKTDAGWVYNTRGDARLMIDASELATGGIPQVLPVLTTETIRLTLGVASTSPANSDQLDLVRGVVQGDTVELVATSSPAEPAFTWVDLRERPDDLTRAPLARATPTINPPEPPARRFSSEAEPTAADADMVTGIHCSRGHFNHPMATYCQVCGISMVHLTHHLVVGPRPTLGFLVFSNGTTFALDRNYLAGRAPKGADGFTPLLVTDPAGSVSADHASIELEEWSVIITDLLSTNGTFVWKPGQNEWHRIEPNQRTPLEPGTIVALGRETFVFESAVRER